MFFPFLQSPDQHHISYVAKWTAGPEVTYMASTNQERLNCPQKERGLDYVAPFLNLGAHYYLWNR